MRLADDADRPRRAANGDLTARARIRDAAVALFAAEGFGVPVRRIAEAAGVSPSLVIHHFGSKEALKAECDRHVGQAMLDVKADTMAQPPGAAQANLLYQLAHADSYGYLVAYVLRSVGEGGAAAAQFIAVMTEATAELLRRGVAAGTMRQSRDIEAMARYLAYSGMGTLMVWQAALPAGTEPGSAAGMDALMEEFALPTLEMGTEGILADSAALDAYLASRPDRAPAQDQSGDHPNPKDNP
ncbi:MAG: TetR family transcriptional regulator [Bifidobacteriaceae bacterium]|jgi:AcrR family transcriptional regulator|nr:TetR family transcriptional regulator [Bifidobacteriaceae bacterium]